MIKGIFGMILGGLIVAAIVLLIFHFFGVFAWIAAALAISALIVIILVGLLVVGLGVLMFFLMFYYLLEKKPEIKAGDYNFDQTHGKHDETIHDDKK